MESWIEMMNQTNQHYVGLIKKVKKSGLIGNVEPPGGLIPTKYHRRSRHRARPEKSRMRRRCQQVSIPKTSSSPRTSHARTQNSTNTSTEVGRRPSETGAIRRTGFGDPRNGYRDLFETNRFRRPRHVSLKWVGEREKQIVASALLKIHLWLKEPLYGGRFRLAMWWSRSSLKIATDVITARNGVLNGDRHRGTITDHCSYEPCAVRIDIKILQSRQNDVAFVTLRWKIPGTSSESLRDD